MPLFFIKIIDNNKKAKKTMKPVDNSNPLANIFDINITEEKKTSSSDNAKQDSLELSNTSKVFSKVDSFFNLGNSDRLNTGKLNSADKKEFLKMVSTLLKNGVVGYEVLKVKGKPEKHFIVTEIGDQRIKGAKLYKRNNDNKTQ